MAGRVKAARSGWKVANAEIKAAKATKAARKASKATSKVAKGTTTAVITRSGKTSTKAYSAGKVGRKVSGKFARNMAVASGAEMANDSYKYRKQQAGNRARKK